ncbi:MAG: envelope stress response membrane protein PspC [Desulfobacteraceae bacterium 4572_87]|nr:MAG: envelope stress response membrane protein PspC [Desulfobacteraceae bacterium 4572_87]
MKWMNQRFQRGMYRSRNGMIMGVIRGLAEYFDFSVFWARTIAVVMLLISGFWPITGLYFLAALIMKPAPVLRIDSDDAHDFYDSYVHSRPRAVNRLKRRYDNIEQRIRRMEDAVTSREYNWEKRFDA